MTLRHNKRKREEDNDDEEEEYIDKGEDLLEVLKVEEHVFTKKSKRTKKYVYIN